MEIDIERAGHRDRVRRWPRIDPHSSLTVWNASSSEKTLGIMLFVTAVLLPIVLAYTAWAYRVMFGRVTAEMATAHPDFY